MSGIVAEKLYPPTIGSSIPAFYVENGTATIAVPFSMNRAVDANSVGGFRLKIKTVQNNSLIKILDITSPASALNSRIAKFNWNVFGQDNNLTTEFNKIKLGLFLKIQIAYIDKSGNVGYFSTVAITKYTSKPNVYIEGIVQEDDQNVISIFKSSYVGVYQVTEDLSERPYSYSFYLYDKTHGLIETSGWKLHNSSVNHLNSESLVLDRTIDTYTFTESLEQDEEYFILYGVRTINNLEVYSPLYPCCTLGIADPEIDINLVAENNFDEAYILLHFQLAENLEGLLDKPVSLEISRASKLNDYSDWRPLKKVYFKSYDKIKQWQFKDFTIEQGINYKYSFRLYNSNLLYSDRKMSNICQADFEDMFLWDGTRQLKIRFNPKVTSFKATRSEQKIETIGSQYPYIFKNGIINYKEFPISGLISYTADNHEMFVNYKDELDIIIPEDYVRSLTPEVDDYIELWNNDFSTTSMTGYNMRAERIFKMKTLEWLNNGEIKLFKSAAEGNYLIRLMNVSLSPEDKLGRMLHTVQATACEVEELNYSNLLSLNFILTDEPTDVEENVLSSTTLQDILFAHSAELNNSVKLNSYTILNYLVIEPSPSSLAPRPGFYIRIGEDNPDNKVFISNKFTLSADNAVLPDLFFNANDNREIMGGTVGYENVLTIIGDTVLTYKYNKEVIGQGELYNIKNILVKNLVETFVGPRNIQFGKKDIVDQVAIIKPIIMKFYVLDFYTKTCITKLLKVEDKYFDYNNLNIEITTFDPTQVYQVAQSTLADNKMVGLFYSNIAGDTLIQSDAPTFEDFLDLTNNETTGVYNYIDLTVILKSTLDNENQREVILTVPVSIDLHTAADFDTIELGWGVYLKAAYQERTIIYNDTQE